MGNLLDNRGLNTGKKTRLHRLMFQYGPGNGKLLLLPIDQGLEHGPRDFFSNPDSTDPEFQLKLALEGGYSGIVFHIGIAEKHMHDYAGQVPLVLKLNGKTEVPADDEAFSPQTASVKDAVRLGADAVGYTLYVGSPAQDKDFIQLMKIRQDCEKFGMPLIIWSYPRGKAVKEKGGQDSLYAIDYASRVANELGADIAKLNYPKESKPEMKKLHPKPYDTLQISEEDMIKKIVKSAGKTMVIISGGSKADDKDVLDKVSTCLKSGVVGFIFGRNMWQRKMEDALKITKQIKGLMASAK